MNADFADDLATKLKETFKSEAVQDGLRLKGTSRENAGKWPSDPEEIGVDMATKPNLSPKDRENYEFWENVKKNGWQVCAGAFERGTQVEPSHVEVLNRWSLRLA